MDASSLLWILAVIIIIVGLFNTKFFANLLIILALLAGLFFLDKFINKKTREPNSSKWRLSVGIIQLSLALLAFIWLMGYAVSKSYILLIVGILIIGIGGIGEIVIGVLNSVAEKKSNS